MAEVLIRTDEGNFVRYHPEDGFEVLKDSDTMLPRRFVATFPDDRGGPELHLRFEMQYGVPQCRELHLASGPDHREIRPVDIRTVDLELYLEVSCQLIAVHVVGDYPGGGVDVVHSHRSADLESVEKRIRRARRNTRRQLPDSKLPEIAEVYRTNPGAGTAAVERHFGLNSRRTASLYVKRARDAGYLDKEM